LKTTRIFGTGVFLLLALFTAACASAATPGPTPPTPTLPGQPTTDPTPAPTIDLNAQVNPKLLEANSNFGFRLFSQLVEQDPNQNIFMSPLSIAMALDMTYNGAEGQTSTDMADTLSIGEMSLEEVNAANLALRNYLSRTSSEVELAIANSLWAREGIDFKAEFLDRNRQYYGAEVTSLDFDDPGAPEAINQWVSDNTNGKINKIADRVDPNMVLFLINAIYFNGQWTIEFDEELTHDGTFYLSDGSEKQHPMMRQSGDYQYLENDSFQAVSLPYGEGEMSMYLFLPKEGSSLDDFLSTLDAQTWGSWLGQFSQREGGILLPKFKVEYETELVDSLKLLGMEVAFDSDRANFDGMHNTITDLYISEVKHKAFIEVNEVGTEAAAVTSVGVGVTSIQPDQPARFSFVADHSFFYAIRDNYTGSVVFMGTLVNPEV
jgi:serpin B